MRLVQQQALQPYVMSGLPVFQAVLASNGSWQHVCLCGDTHAYTPGEGPRRARCAKLQPAGVYLLAPEPK